MSVVIVQGEPAESSAPSDPTPAVVPVELAELTATARELGELRARVQAAELQASEAATRAERAAELAASAHDAAARLASEQARDAAARESESEPDDAASEGETGATLVVPELPPPSAPTPEPRAPRGWMARLLLG